ncbi:MAG: hypothetical protein HY000_06190, partial [Planctomycetes bacterium]|nr:hypothetical protein [Planctomycetota bacterium]
MRRYSALMALLLGLGVVSMQGDGSADEGPSQAQRTEECSGCTCVQGPIEDVYDQETGEYLYTIFYADDHQDCTCSNPQASYFTSSTPEGSPGWPETCTYEEGATSCSCTPSHVAHSRTPPDPFPGRREKVSNEQHYEPRFPPHWNKSENRREVDPAPAFGR